MQKGYCKGAEETRPEICLQDMREDIIMIEVFVYYMLGRIWVGVYPSFRWLALGLRVLSVLLRSTV